MMTRKRSGDVKKSINPWEKLGNLKIMTFADVTSKGNSLYVLLSRDVAEIHGVVSGDRVRVWFLDHYRKKKEEE